MITLESSRKYPKIKLGTKSLVINLTVIFLRFSEMYCVHLREVFAFHLFYVGVCQTNAGESVFLRRMVETYNKFFNNIDIFSISLKQLKLTVLQCLNNDDLLLVVSYFLFNFHEIIITIIYLINMLIFVESCMLLLV